MIGFLAWSLVWLIAFFCVLWAFGALYYDFPIHGFGQWAAILFVVASVAALIFIRGQGKKLAARLPGFWDRPLLVANTETN